MNNLKRTIWNLRLPPFIGVLFLVFSIGVLTWLTSNTVLFGTKAAADDTPIDVQISNITDTSFTVSYRTNDKVIGALSYGMTTGFGAVAIDSRDASDAATPGEHWIHSFTIENLTPSTKHYFVIASGTDTFLNGAVPYEVTTAPKGSIQPTSQQPIIGTVQLQDGGIPAEAIAYVTINDAQLLSAVVKVDGTYEIPLNTIRKKDLSGQLTLDANTPILITVQDATSKSNVQAIASQTNPVPMVILNKDYNFSLETGQPASGSASASDSATITPVAFPTTAEPGPAEPKIIAPVADQEFKDQQPLFKGKALPNTEVTITIQSDPITTTVTSDADGNWEYRPEQPLEPGDHTLTVETPDSSGLMKTLTQQFTVFAEGSQFIEPSISPIAGTPTKAPIVTPTPTSAIPTQVTPTTATQAATTAPTIAPTAITTPPVATTIAPTSSAIITQPPIPKSGSSAMIIGFIAAALFIGIGALVIIL